MFKLVFEDEVVVEDVDMEAERRRGGGEEEDVVFEMIWIDGMLVGRWPRCL